MQSSGPPVAGTLPMAFSVTNRISSLHAKKSMYLSERRMQKRELKRIVPNHQCNPVWGKFC